jgi:hypothetical protein
MTSTAHPTGSSSDTDADQQPAKHVHHGRTPAAWAGTMITSLAFLVGAIGLVLNNWPVFWVAVGLIVVALLVTIILQKTGHGAA